MKFYRIFSVLAFALFVFAQYNGYGFFGVAATGRATGQTGTHSIFHK